jgi:hypothetical protein
MWLAATALQATALAFGPTKTSLPGRRKLTGLQGI